ncbi:galactose/methyl galactoside ABC transporter permease MglC [Clostridium chromiireducens]|uniref:Galactose/methyl galactoside ABC transporter permease MglC n=1 Tax=Clostridium chromiireducens TaxID=225345 RepID=A0A1V4ILK9_9CLOT|nr:galactose/methyl galactoside ABC transporter permease MglC [Clostridium chromiireducens]OPJ60918.1 galactoside transport system permease protein MglC [Clostridium chromiireducens]RII36305.1 galactose/methyl galactoside ABC transporter permease MglC [Clostridium chromiireducens]
MNGEKIVSRKDFGKIFLGIGALFVALGIVFNFILDPDVFYDLPIYIDGIGIALLIYGGKQFLDKNNADMEVIFSNKTVKNFLTDNAIIIALLLLVVVIMVIQPRFMQYAVFLDILTQSSTRMIVALGICFTLLIAGTDLSAGRMVGLAAVVSTSMLQNPDYANRFFPDMPQLAVIIPILIAIAACAIFGILNGFLVAKYDMHPFIATLASQVIVYGVTSLYFDLPPNKSQPIGGIRQDFIDIGQTKLFQIGSFPGISILVPIAVVFIILVWFILNKTVFGKNVYAIGGNREAAVVSGVNVFVTIMGIFIFASLLYGVAGVLEAARTAGATNNYGNGYELDAIAACVVGGVSLNGGVGKVGGIVVGVLIFTVIQYGLQFIAVSPMWQQVIKGVIIAVAVAIDLAKYRRK